MTNLSWIVIWLASQLIASLSISGQQYTEVMSGENSEYYCFQDSGCANKRSTVTSLKSPYTYPNTNIGNTDEATFPNGNSSGTPPWWFVYKACAGTLCFAQDLTPEYPWRNPSNGQTSTRKSGVIGIKARGAFEGSLSVSDDASEVYEAIYFHEHYYWAGTREFGFFRLLKQDKIFFYWSTNSNCSDSQNLGYSYCRTSQVPAYLAPTPNDVENALVSPLLDEKFESTEVTGVTTGTTYTFISYLFWASWDSTYKFRVEVWDSTSNKQITAFNADASGYGATTSGMDGYVTVGLQKIDPNGVITQKGTQLSVSSIHIAQ